MIRAAFSVFLIALLPSGVQAGWSFTQSCGGGYGSNTHRFSSKSACQSKLAQTKRAIARQGGGCTFSSCKGSDSSSTGRQSGSSGLSMKREIGAAIGQAVGQAIVDGLFSSPRRNVYAEHQAELARQRRRVAECETRKARSVAFDRDKADALSQMKGSDDEGLGLKLESYDGEFSSLDFKTYVDDESIRRDILAGIRGNEELKELYGWCVLHMPLRPTAPTHDGLDCDYEIALERFYERRNDWEAKCDPEHGGGGGGGSGSSAEGGLTFKPVETGTETPDKPKKETSQVLGINTPYYSEENGTKKEEISKEEAPLKPTKCSDCSLIRTRTSNGCKAKFDKDLRSGDFHDCIKNSNDEFEKCKDQLCP